MLKRVICFTAYMLLTLLNIICKGKNSNIKEIIKLKATNFAWRIDLYNQSGNIKYHV